jgi:hypothetical protein
MSDFSLSPRFLDLILLITAAEFVFLGFRNARSGHGLQWADLGMALAPGFLLMLAFRMSQPNGLPLPVLLCLSAAGVVHALDFFRRHQAITAAA